jgi:DNA-binding XRE family transcriptional regulator
MAEIVVGKWEIGSSLPSTHSFIRWAHVLDHTVCVLDRSGRPVAAAPERRSADGTFEQHEVRRIVAALRRARIEADRTQKDLGAALDVTEWTLRSWESSRRQPRLLHIVSWAEALGCRVTLTEDLDP